MKKNYILAFVFMAFWVNLNAQTFVKSDATGNNDGTTWADAYTDLSMALDNTIAGDIWVANGTYKPGSGSATVDSRFAMENQINLYGGFQGTESTLDERDLTIANTVLSGDLNDDDTPGDFLTNKSDNIHHVLYVDSSITSPIIDGFIITSGNTEAFVDGADFYTYSGGGLFSYGAIILKNTTFTNNTGDTGSACYVRIGAGTYIENITVTSNSSVGGGVFQIAGGSNVTLTESTFSNNSVERGSFYPLYCSGITISNCNFNNNDNPVGFGGAGLFSWSSSNLILDGCNFDGNSADKSPAIYLDGRDLAINEVLTTITNCVFENNTANNYGGAVLLYKVSANITESNFEGNTAGGNGGALISFGDDYTTTISNTKFETNTGNFGGAINFQSLADVTFTNNVIINNSATVSGGSTFVGFGVNATFIDNQFVNNTSQFAAAIYCQTDSTTINLMSNNFTGNVAESIGGGMIIGNGSSFQITDNDFSTNSSMGTAGAISISIGDDDTVGENALIARNTFTFNSANQGSAINLDARNTTVTDNLFTENSATETGTGTISINAGDTTNMEVHIANNTFFENTGALAQGVAVWTGEVDANLNTYFQNNIFANGDAANYAIEGGTPISVSLGGNFSNDESMNDILTATRDISGIDNDPLFVDVDNENYNLQSTSPCVNTGINLGASETDLFGHVRVDTVDMGALESPFLIAIKELVKGDSKDVKLTPNPAVDFVTININNSWSGEFTINVYSLDGKLIKSENNTKVNGIYAENLEVSNLKSGVYILTISNGSELYRTTLIKK